MAPPWAAVILAGGQARRLGGADKPGITVRGRTLVTTVVSVAVQAGARRIVVVGPGRPDLTTEVAAAADQKAPAVVVEFAREDPPGTGPVPALRAGLALVAEPWLALLAADLPFVQRLHLRAILAAARRSGGAMLTDDQGRPQWLASCWRTAGLRHALAGYGGDSLRGLLDPLQGTPLTMLPRSGQPPPWLDCDTPEDVAAARGWPLPGRPCNPPGNLEVPARAPDEPGLSPQ